MPLKKRIPIDDLSLGLVILDPLLFMLQFWRKDLTMPSGKVSISLEQRLFMCDQSTRILLCSGRKIGKTLVLERNVIQIGLTYHSDSDQIIECMFVTPAMSHMRPTLDRIISRITRVPIFMESIARNQQGNLSIHRNEGVIRFKSGVKWHFRVEGITGTDVNMVGLRAHVIIGDEMAFSSEVCHRSRLNSAMPGCRWIYCGVPNGVRGTPFWLLDQTQMGSDWSRHRYPQYINPLFASEKERMRLIQDHGGENTHSYQTQVLGRWGDEVMSVFPPGTIAVHNGLYRKYRLERLDNTHEREKVIEDLRVAGIGRDRKPCVIGMDFGVSPDPSAIAIFVMDGEPNVWYMRAMMILRGVQFPYQVAFVDEMSKVLNIQMFVTDQATLVQQLSSMSGWNAYSGATATGNVAWANIGGKMELLDQDSGEIITDESGMPLREHRKKWATDELRNAMVHTKSGLPYPYYLWLGDDDELIDELSSTTERHLSSGHVQYIVPKKTDGSSSLDDHRTDALRYAILAIRFLYDQRHVRESANCSRYIGVAGWYAIGRQWNPPWGIRSDMTASML